MEKTDLTKKYKTYYTARNSPAIVDIEPARFISVRGKGDPSGQGFADHIEALYTTAYTLKFACKAREKDFVVSKLEGLWWFDEARYPGKNIITSVEVPRSEWEYRLMIRMPEYISEPDVKEAVAEVLRRKKLALATQIQFHEMHEGKSVQMLHTGPFSEEPRTLLQIDTFMNTHKLQKNGLHHEIYLSDFRRTESGKLRTILREPVR